MTLSHTLQSSPNQDQDQRPQSLFSLHLITLSPNPRPQLRVSDLTLSLSNRNIISLTLKVTFSHLCISLSLSISISNLQIKSLKSLHQILKSHTNTLCLSLSNLCSPFTNFIQNLKSSSVFNLHSLKACIFGLLTNEQTTLSKTQFSLCLSLLQGPNPSFSLQVLHT